MKVYEYLLTMQSSFSAQLYPDWYGVVHGDELQVIAATLEPVATRVYHRSSFATDAGASSKQFHQSKTGSPYLALL